MRLTQSQTQMLGMLVVGLVLYMMFNRYQSHQQRGMFDNWVKAAETIVPQEAQDAVVEVVKAAEDGDLAAVVQEVQSLGVQAGITKQMVDTVRQYPEKIFMGDADWQSLGWTPDILQYFQRATPNSKLGIDEFNDSVEKALDWIDAMLENRIAFTLPLTYQQAMTMQGLSDKYLQVVGQMTQPERKRGMMREVMGWKHRQGVIDPLSLSIIAGTIISIGAMYTYVYVRSMEEGYCVDHKCAQDAEAECNPGDETCTGKISSDCHVVLKPNEKC
jgi:hypothetical protein